MAEVDEGIDIAARAIAAAGDDPEVLTAAGHTLAFFAGESEPARRCALRAMAVYCS